MNVPGPTLIRSKLQVPAPSGLLHRSRLCQAIEQGLERKLTLVSAPAGYGKTSALIDFARHTSVPVCWYTVDERDRDLSLFLRYVVAAIREQFPGFGEGTREVIASRQGDLFREPTAVVGDLVNEMLDLKQDFVLVMDNFEPVDGAFGIRGFLHRLLEVLPSNCHLMLGSRVLPDVPVTRLVAKRQLVGLTENDLRFEPEEIRRLLGEAGLTVSEKQTRAIARSSEGWITGVLLILDLLRGDVESVTFDADKATSQTYGYLASEVLDRQPPDVRWFLQTSSVLREMSPRLCAAVLDVDRAQIFLTEIERRNLFLTRFGDDNRVTYRYHNLFRDFLHRRLRRRDSALYVDLHRRAGAWFERVDDVEEAVYHYLAAEAYREATSLMDRVAMEWFTRGRVETLLRWAAALPEQVRSCAPWLALYQSRALTDRYAYAEAREALTFAETGFKVQNDTLRLAKVHIQRATLGLFEDRSQHAIDQARLALTMLDPSAKTEHADAKRHIGKAYVALGHILEGVTELQEALSLYRQADSPYDVVNLLQDLTFAYASLGQLDKAAACVSEALPLARRLGSPSQLGGVLNNLGMLHYERGDYQRALSLHQEGLSVARRAGDTRLEASLAEGMATIYRDAGVYQPAEVLYDVAWQIARRSRPRTAVQILVARADMYRWRDDRPRALALLEQAEQLSEENDLHLDRRGTVALSKGIALAESGERKRGIQLLSESIQFLKQQGAVRDLARGRFLLAEAHLLSEEKNRASANLRSAMKLADEIGTIQFAIAEGKRAEALVQLGLARGLAGCRELAQGIERLQTFNRELTDDLAVPQEEPRKRLEIYGLGEGRVVLDGHLVPGSAWQAAMARELFFYILLHGPVERDAVGLVFWPELPSDKVTNNFHSTLYRVRRALGSEAVVVKNGLYQLGDIDYWFDVKEFESLVERAQLLPPHDWQAEELWRRAVGLYQGDLLTEVDRAWCVPKRESLRMEHIEALIGLGRCHEARRAFGPAVDWYRRALRNDRLREDVHRRIMRCYAEAGRRSKAVAQYRECRAVLQEELGVSPSSETVNLCTEIAGQRPS